MAEALQGDRAKLAFTGVAGQPYTAYEYDYVNNVLVGSKYFYTNVLNQAYSSYETDLDATGAVALQVLNNTDGTHRIVWFQNDLTIGSISNDVITGGGSAETFAIKPLSGNETITDFYQYMTGTGHDTIQLAAGEYSNFATLLQNASVLMLVNCIERDSPCANSRTIVSAARTFVNRFIAMTPWMGKVLRQLVLPLHQVHADVRRASAPFSAQPKSAAAAPFGEGPPRRSTWRITIAACCATAGKWC